MTQVEAAPRIESDARPVKGVLVSMPWATTIRPSPAVGILTRICEENEGPVVAMHTNLDIEAHIGFDDAATLATSGCSTAGPRTCSTCDLFGKDALDSEKFPDGARQTEPTRPGRWGTASTCDSYATSTCLPSSTRSRCGCWQRNPPSSGSRRRSARLMSSRADPSLRKTLTMSAFVANDLALSR